MRRGASLILAVVIAAPVHLIAGRMLAGRDVVLSILAGHAGWTLLLIAALLGARLFLFLLAPGWALYLLASAALQRFTERGRSP